jgi:putative sterol carrier protein
MKEKGVVTKGEVKKPGELEHLSRIVLTSCRCYHYFERRYTYADELALTVADTFMGLADGKVNAQKAFMTGSLKVKGNVRPL